MNQNGRVVLTDVATGRIGLQLGEDGFVLAEQLDAQPLELGGMLSGRMDTIGIETLTDARTGTAYNVFIVAYGLSREAVEQELR